MMSTVQNPKRACRNYLLVNSHDAPAPDQESFEEHYFVNNDLFLELLNERARVMIEFVRGKLERKEAEFIERKCATNAFWRSELLFFSALTALDRPQNLFIDKNRTSDETNLESSSLMGISH
jgi:hypothetical protein